MYKAPNESSTAGQNLLVPNVINIIIPNRINMIIPNGIIILAEIIIVLVQRGKTLLYLMELTSSYK